MSQKKEDIRIINIRYDKSYLFEEEANKLLEDGYVLFHYQIVDLKGLYLPMIHAIFIKNLDYNRDPPDVISVVDKLKKMGEL